jgi:hypothetical protein
MDIVFMRVMMLGHIMTELLGMLQALDGPYYAE